MGAEILPPTTDLILEQCPRFRILVVGKSGVGKSSLINHAFNVDLASVSHKEHGICNIDTEIISPENPRFVLHDSQGFEPGETGNLERVKNFIRAHGEDVPLKDRLHAVWLCIQVPYAGGRIFETGDEEFLKFTSRVPIVVVFTKFDILVSSMEMNLTDEEMDMSDEDIHKLCLERADREFEELCVAPLRKINGGLTYAKVAVKDPFRPALAGLINSTQALVAKHVEGDVWIVSAMAQRASAQAKIDSSIDVGMKQYWQGLASSTSLSGATLDQCLTTIHSDITSSWNFNDPDNLLNSSEFRKKIQILVQLVTLDPAEDKSWFKNLEQIQTLIGVGSALSPDTAPALAAIGLSTMFIKWITRVYQKTPEVLRCLMGYIVDLTLVMDHLFLLTLAIKPPYRLDEEHIAIALETYKSSDAASVHRNIRKYTDKTSFGLVLQSNNAHEKIIELIRQHRNT